MSTDEPPVELITPAEEAWLAAKCAELDLIAPSVELGDALEQALYDLKPSDDGSLTHHSDKGSQYSERLAEAGIELSVGCRGDSYDNALAETINGLYRAEVIHRRGPWKTKQAAELATLEWVAPCWIDPLTTTMRFAAPTGGGASRSSPNRISETCPGQALVRHESAMK